MSPALFKPGGKEGHEFIPFIPPADMETCRLEQMAYWAEQMHGPEEITDKRLSLLHDEGESFALDDNDMEVTQEKSGSKGRNKRKISMSSDSGIVRDKPSKRRKQQ
jgi:hypothetical protein